MANVPCPHCEQLIPDQSAVCWRCLQPVKTQLASETPGEARRRAARPKAERWWGLWLLPAFYVGYGATYLLTTIENMPDGLAGPTLAAHLFSPVITIALVVLAIVRVRREPFVWSITLAGLQTLYAINAQYHGQSSALIVGATIGLWVVAFLAPRVERGLAGRGLDPKFHADDRRVVAAVIWVYLGIIATLLITIYMPFLGLWLFYPGLLVVGTIALRVLGVWWWDVMPLGIGPRGAAWGIGTGIVYAVVGWTWFAWWTGSWTPTGWTLGSISGTAFFLSAVLPGVVEEALCRGVLWQAVRERAGKGGAIVATAALFALLHVVFAEEMPGLPIQFVGGLLLGLVRVMTGSVGACILSHIVGNALLVSLAVGSV